MSWEERSGSAEKAASSSCAVRPEKSGAIRGCRIVTVPSSVRASLQLSSEWASVTCQWQRREVSSS